MANIILDGTTLNNVTYLDVPKVGGGTARFSEGGGGGTYQSKSKTYTPTESQQTESVTADAGYDALSTVTVKVNAISSYYVGSGVTRNDSSDLTASGATVTAPAGYYASSASKSVASGTAGTPTATKGTVSSHSVTVTPSVTNTTGYITGGTKTGTAVTVSASELVSGSETKTANGTYDVTNLAEIVVDVSGGVTPTGTISITTNGSHDVTNFATAEVDVPATVGTKESASQSSTTTTLSISGLAAKPAMWALQLEISSGSYVSGASTRYITSALCSGGTTVYSTCIYKSGSTAREYGYNTITWSYNNGTITFTSPGTSTAGGFRTGSKYRLFYAY